MKLSLAALLLSALSPAAAWVSAPFSRTSLGVNQLHMSASEETSEPEEDLVTSRQPHELSNGKGTFLGFRSVKGFRSAARKSGLTSLNLSSDAALMPDGGLSPCVIRVLGVGGGGCNAVSLLRSREWPFLLLECILSLVCFSSSFFTKQR